MRRKEHHRKYENAKDILPASLLAEVQKYAEGKAIYISKRIMRDIMLTSMRKKVYGDSDPYECFGYMEEMPERFKQMSIFDLPASSLI
jgi:hypothetical protein